LRFGARCVAANRPHAGLARGRSFSLRGPAAPLPEPATCRTAEKEIAREVLVADLSDGQFANPVTIIAFNTASGWSRRHG
jgi:hypothetical protein